MDIDFTVVVNIGTKANKINSGIQGWNWNWV